MLPKKCHNLRYEMLSASTTSRRLLSPISSRAETIWLVLSYDGMKKNEMESLAQCEEEGYIASSKKNGLITNQQPSMWTVKMAWKYLKCK